MFGHLIGGVSEHTERLSWSYTMYMFSILSVVLTCYSFLQKRVKINVLTDGLPCVCVCSSLFDPVSVTSGFNQQSSLVL